MVAERFRHQFDLHEAPIGGAALRRGLPPLPEPTLAAARKADAILLGAVGDPEFDRGDSSRRPETALLAIRRELQLYANLRPAKVWPGLEASGPLKPEILAGTDLLVVRELTGGLVLRGAARHRGRRQLGAQHDALLARGDRAHRAPGIRRGAIAPEARDLGGQGERAGDVAALAAGRDEAGGGLRRTSRSITCTSTRAR